MKYNHLYADRPLDWQSAVVVYPNDHRPAHVHVMGQSREAVYELNRPLGSVSLRENYGFKRRELNRIERALIDNLAALLNAWERIHGER